jgi:hypothetical protein
MRDGLHRWFFGYARTLKPGLNSSSAMFANESRASPI